MAPSDTSTWRLYFIPQAGGREALARLAGLGLEGGADVLQLRLKGAGDREWLESGRDFAQFCRRHGRPLIINDRPDIALALGADGVHLGREDASVRAARRVLGGDAVIGVTVFGPEEALRARDEGADYVAIGPVFATPVKGGIPPVGLQGVSRVREAVDGTVVAIGGINASNAAGVMEAGADAVAVISAISGAGDPRAAAVNLREVVVSSGTRRRVYR